MSQFELLAYLNSTVNTLNQIMSSNNSSVQVLRESLDIHVEKFESSMQRFLRKNSKPFQQQYQLLQLHICEFKSSIFQWISSIVGLAYSSDKPQRQRVQSLIKQILKQSKKVEAKLKLHVLLKNKLKRMKQQSFLQSMNASVFKHREASDLQCDQTIISSLEKSVLQMEKDLKIESSFIQFFKQDLEVSSVISRSMRSLNQTAIQLQENSNNNSFVTDYSLQNETMTKSIVGKNCMNTAGDDKLTYQTEVNFKAPGAFQKKELVKSGVGVQCSEILLSKQQGVENDSINTNSQYQLKSLEDTAHKSQKKIEPKSKRSVYSKKNKIQEKVKERGQSKEGILGNLLQDAYQSCVE